MASHMCSSALLDFAMSSSSFHHFLTANITDVVLNCLYTQFGYIPDLTQPAFATREEAEAAAAAAVSASRASAQLLAELPQLHFLIREEQLGQQPEHRALLSLLSSATGELMSGEDQELLYGAGVRGLLRYLQRYHALRKHLPLDAAKRKLRAFLLRHYTLWGIHEIAGVYECLCDIIGSRAGAGTEDDDDGGGGSGSFEDLAAWLVAELEVLRMPARNARWWVQQLEDALRRAGTDPRRENKWFFCEPVGEALRRLHGEAAAYDSSADSDEEDGDLGGQAAVAAAARLQFPWTPGRKALGWQKSCVAVAVESPGVLEKLGAEIEAEKVARRRRDAFAAAL